MHPTKIAFCTLAAAALVLTGCSSGDPSTSPVATGTSSSAPEDSASDEPTEDDGAAAGGDLVAWAGEFCSVSAPLQQELEDLSSNFVRDPDDPLGAMSDMIDQLGPAFDAAADAIEDVGPPPVDGGDEAFDALLSSFRSAGDVYTDLQDQLADLDPTDPNLQAELARIFSTLTPELEESGRVIGEVFESDEMADAFASAPECAGLDLAQ